LEDLYPDDAFLQLFGVAIQLVPDNVFQKLPASRGAFEEFAFQNSIKFFAYKGCVLLPNGSGLGSFVGFVGMFGSGGHKYLLPQPKGHSEQSLQWLIPPLLRSAVPGLFASLISNLIDSLTSSCKFAYQKKFRSPGGKAIDLSPAG
jgi:hypothetical protein